MSVVIVTATGVEARAARRALPDMQVINGGIALAKLQSKNFDAVIVCGVAGGLRASVPTGTVIIASEILRPNGSTTKTDPELTTALASGAHNLGFTPLIAPILASTTFITGKARADWATKGYAAVNMESGLIEAHRLAVVRVILDTPEHELSPDWLHPVTACLKPHLWKELRWLTRNASPCAHRAASVVRAGLKQHLGLSS